MASEMTYIETFILNEEYALKNALNKLARVKRGLDCGFLNEVEAKEEILVARNELESELLLSSWFDEQ